MWVQILSGLALALLLDAAQAAAPQRFKSSVDVVQVDVSAIDSDGRPITGLTAADFELRVDGRVRPIASVQFVTVPPDVRSGPPLREQPAPRYATNDGAAGGRLIMIVIDRSSIASGRGKSAIEAASRFVSQLNRADRVALASIPDGPQVAFTADHALVQHRIQEIDGTAVASLGEHNLGVADAMAFERRNDLAMQSVYERECGSPSTGAGGTAGGQSDVLVCMNAVRSEAAVVADDARQRARSSIRGLRDIIDGLPPSQTPKMLVLISEGLVVDREIAQLAWLDGKAAGAHVTIYSLLLESLSTDASQRRPEAQPAANRALRQQGLDRIAQATRGDVFQVLANSDFAFHRLALELSGYYLLGFQPEDADRGGRPHTIDVKVKRRGVTVRSRRQFSIGAAPIDTVESQVVAALRDPLPATEIPIKLSTYTFRDPHHDKLRLLIAAEIDRSGNPSGRLSAGYVVVDFDGKLVTSQMDLTLQTPPRDEKLQQYFSAAPVDAGKYSVKLVVVDDSRRRGSVEVMADAHLTAAGPLRATDILIADAATAGGAVPLAPAIGGDITGTTLHAYLELFGDAAETLANANVTLEIAATASSPALERVPVELRPTKESSLCRIAAARVNIARFPAGDYIARAVIGVGLDAVGQVTRPFRIVRQPSAPAPNGRIN